MNLLMFHVKRGGLGMALGCGSPPLLAVVGIGVSRGTSAFLQAIFPVPTVVFCGKR